jgi:hypothetical protein
MGSSGGGPDMSAIYSMQAAYQKAMLDFMKQSEASQMEYQNKVLANQEAAQKQAETDQRNAISASDTAAGLQAGRLSQMQAEQALASQGQAQSITDASKLAEFNKATSANASAQTGAGGYNIPAAQQTASAALAGAGGYLPNTGANTPGQQPTKNPVTSAIAGAASAANPTNTTSQSNSLFPNLNGISTTTFGGG